MGESPKNNAASRPAKLPVGKPAPAAASPRGGQSAGGADIAREPAEIRRKLAWRMGFAGFLILLLLAALALFDQLNTSDEEPEAPTFTEPVPVGRKEITQPVTPAEAPLVPGSPPEREAQTASSAAKPESGKKADAAPAQPESSAAPLGPPPRPEVHAQPVEPKVESRPAAPALQRAAPLRQPAAPAVAPAPSSSSTASTARPAETSAVRQPAEALAPRPASTAAPTQMPARVEEPAPARLPPAPARLFSGYALQAGVFADPRRAEELHARLTLNGIPSTLEARVHVGPFKSREEADAAREKMKSLGIDAVMLLPKGGRR